MEDIRYSKAAPVGNEKNPFLMVFRTKGMLIAPAYRQDVEPEHELRHNLLTSSYT
jgi:hypothetical protein